ncbi:guanine deaminase [Agrobacterium vitis]|uniref:Guanine deaminase n=1 Tax=Agrobacterium vitis TaxID=373 RepID=A0A368P1D9_AGRVI|nr:guanine deaminase [Agrobacterium vitis]KAA3518415.1 guanine deaminase [Agrobacterium vitis]KAA3530012.1 guanine deaminase [Agrobacterium vitis]MCF1476633.1 guanine deaminase [Agrobacterium vitis]MUZ96171.1 guanine deaminase [Agrobacterium vitis]MVA29280.1 guanine deaminase [Agrobacterium vitis]
MSDFRNRVLIASGFHAPVPGEIDVLTDCLIAIDAHGEILSVQRPGDEGYGLAKAEADRKGRLSRLPAGCLLLPGLVDCHVHAPQYPQLGTALDVPLETWLHAHTFPLEARYADVAYAKRVYGLLVDDLVANGTTTALYFATIHQDATRILVDTCLEKGQRALIGKVAMDNAEQCPDYYRDASPDAALQGTQALIDYISGHPNNTASRVWPVVTPRFIPACTDATLEGLGTMARDCGCHVQTHCSESDWEHAYVLSRHGMTDAMSLDRFGLLTRRSMLAHANLLTADDMDLIKLRQAAVAHCPLSNGYFAGAVFPLRAALEKGLHVGLGSDISGGPSASLFDNMRAAILVSRMLETGVDPGLPPDKRASGAKARIDFRHAFHIATAGGGKALDLPIGQFAPGYRFDAIVIDPQAAQGTLRLSDGDEMTETLLQKIIFNASRANISAVFIDGRKVA